MPAIASMHNLIPSYRYTEVHLVSAELLKRVLVLSRQRVSRFTSANAASQLLRVGTSVGTSSLGEVPMSKTETDSVNSATK
jgi:hypothetical protein